MCGVSTGLSYVGRFYPIFIFFMQDLNTKKHLRNKLLGGLSPARFLREHWQKKPLLVRGAFVPGSEPGFEPLTIREVLTLANYPEAESRLISRKGKQWSLQHGPIGKRGLAAVRGQPWTVLVQDTQHYTPAAHALLSHFDFIPRARVDDLMVSYAVPGGGVGPHLDSYDVFLLQGTGTRRWRISEQKAGQKDARFLPDTPVKILAKFQPEQEWVLEPGDMLYLPPGVAHEGVAQSECLTWSIGFRAPSAAELSAAFLDFLRDEVLAEGEFRDPDLGPATRSGLIDRKLSRRLLDLTASTERAARDPELKRRFLGCYLTEPKQHVFFDPRERPLAAALFRKQAAKRGLELDGRSRMLYDARSIYLNGEELGSITGPLALLADRRTLAGAQIDAPSADALYPAYRAGYLHLPA